MEVMTFNIDKDRRNLVDDKQNFNIDFHDSKYNWLQARQYEESMRQVEVHVVHGNGSPVDLTGINPIFEGWMPEGLYRIIDAKHSVMIDAQNGIFRFDFPAPAFQIAGSYKQAFFRLMKDGKSVTTLEFSLEVLADKVISGLVPSDYITPFEDLYFKLKDYIAKANGDFDAAMAQWKKDVADLITELNADIGGINLTITEIKAQLSALEDKIKADGLVTLDQLNSILDEFKSKLDAIPVVDSKMDIGGELTPEMKSVADKFISALPKNGFKFLMVTDSHYEDTAFPLPGLGYPHGKESLWHLSIVNYLANYVDVVVAGGDNTNGMTWDYTHTVADQDLYATKLLDTPGTADKFLLKGNHDDGSAIMRNGTIMPDGTRKMGSAQPSDVMTDDDFKRVFRTREQLYNEHRQDGDSLYFYKDYPDSKIRLIGLDSFDVPMDTVNDDGTLTHMRYITTSFSNKQLNWLISEALMNVPEDYQVIITTHCPQVGGDIAEDPESTWFNHELLQGILDSFVDGTSYTGQSPAETPKEMFAKVSTNFTGQGPRVIAGYYVGHYHTERIEKLDNFTEVLFLNDVNGDQTQSAESFGVNSMGISVATIDTAKRSVQINGLGRATNRSYTY